MESTIGEDPAFNDLRVEKFSQVTNSNSILINKSNIKAAVYPYEADKLILNVDENFEKAFREHHLLQVFVNSRILHESYIEELKFPIELPIDEDLKKVKFEVEIKLVK